MSAITKPVRYGLFVLENTETSFGHVELAARIDYVDSEPATLDEERDIDFVAPCRRVS